MTLADINVDSIKINGVEYVDSSGNIIGEGTVANYGHMYAGTYTFMGTNKIYESSNGLTWNLMTSNLGTNNFYDFCRYNNSLFGSCDNKILISEDGYTWNVSSDTGSQVAVLYQFNNSLFAGSGNNIVVSNNGLTWNVITNTGNTVITFSEFNNSLFGGTSAGKIVKSADGFTWDTVTTATAGTVSLTTFNNSLCFVDNDILFVSNDNGLSWNLSTDMSGASVMHLTVFNNSLFMGFGDTLAKSSDGFAWDIITTCTGGSYFNKFCEFNNSLFAHSGATMGADVMYISSDGNIWTNHAGAAFTTALIGVNQNLNIGMIQNNSAGGSAGKLSSDTSDNSGIVILKGKDGNDYKMFVDSNGALQTIRM